jgi:hypothetical protein
MGIRLPFRGFADKRVEANFGAIAEARSIRILEDTQGTLPPSGEMGTVILYGLDDGAGKLQLMAQFPTGAAVQVGIEP